MPLSSKPISNPSSFHAEARYQGVCAVTGKGGEFEAHHVIYQQHLRRLGVPEYDTRNALRVGPGVHDQHHNRKRPIRTKEVLSVNIGYAVDVMGALSAVEYFRRYYDDTFDPDPRLEILCLLNKT
ncbi:MAG: hypothetical protein NVS3B1_22050 [Marmoricola sp.]